MLFVHHSSSAGLNLNTFFSTGHPPSCEGTAFLPEALLECLPYCSYQDVVDLLLVFPSSCFSS